jgi:hypothetical protein
MAKAREATAMVDLKLRLREPLRLGIERAAAAKGVSMNAEMNERLGASFERGRALDEALTFSYGEDAAGLLRLLGEVIRSAPGACGLSSHSDWLNDPSALAMAARGVMRVLQRLQPAGEVKVTPHGAEHRADALLWDLGDDGSVHPGPSAERAADMRQRLGRTLDARLVEMRRRDLAALQAGPARELPQADPEIAASWDRVLEDVQTRKPRKSGKGSSR